MAEVVHRSPRRGEWLTPCCGMTPFELPRDDRLTLDDGLVTCGVSRDSQNDPPEHAWDDRRVDGLVACICGRAFENTGRVGLEDHLALAAHLAVGLPVGVPKATSDDLPWYRLCTHGVPLSDSCDACAPVGVPDEGVRAERRRIIADLAKYDHDEGYEATVLGYRRRLQDLTEQEHWDRVQANRDAAESRVGVDLGYGGDECGEDEAAVGVPDEPPTECHECGERRTHDVRSGPWAEAIRVGAWEAGRLDLLQKRTQVGWRDPEGNLHPMAAIGARDAKWAKWKPVWVEAVPGTSEGDET